MAETPLSSGSDVGMAPRLEGQVPLRPDVYEPAEQMAGERRKGLEIAKEQLAANPDSVSAQQLVAVMEAEVARFEQDQPPSGS